MDQLPNTEHYVTTSSDSPMSLMAITDGQPKNTNPLFNSSTRSETSAARSSSDNIGAPHRRARREGGMRQRHAEEEELDEDPPPIIEDPWNNTGSDPWQATWPAYVEETNDNDLDNENAEPEKPCLH